MTMPSKWILTAAVILLVALVGVVLIGPKKIVAPTNQANSNVSVINSPTNQGLVNTDPAYPGVVFSTADLPDRDPHFEFMVTIPSGWVAEYLAAGPAINFYIPTGAGKTTIEKSRIFVTFTTPDTPLSGSLKISGLTAQEAEATNIKVGNKAKPSWLIGSKQITEVQTTTAAPYTIVQFSPAPDLPNTVFDGFLNSLTF